MTSPINSFPYQKTFFYDNLSKKNLEFLFKKIKFINLYLNGEKKKR